MKAMVLAAGLGERMWPLTEDRAKPSLPLLNRPIIAHTLEHLARHGVKEAVINLHSHPESIRGIVSDGSKLGIKVHYSEEPIILGTAGGLKKAEPLLQGSGSFFMVNSDSLTDCDLTAALKKHRESGALATMVLAPLDPKAAYSPVEMDERDRIVRIAGRPASDPAPGAGRYIFTGVHVLEPAIFDSIPAGKCDINRDVYPPLLTAERNIRGFVHSGFWKELGNPRLYLEGALAVLKDGKDASIGPLRALDGIYLDRITPPADLSLEPPVFIGRGTTIGARCSLQGGVVLGRQATLGKGCTLRSTLVWDGARIGDGSNLSDCIVTSGVFVPPGVSLTGKIFLRADGRQKHREKLERLGQCWTLNL